MPKLITPRITKTVLSGIKNSKVAVEKLPRKAEVAREIDISTEEYGYFMYKGKAFPIIFPR